MASNTDIAIVLSSVLSFLIFLAAHFITFRRLKDEKLFQGIIATFAGAAVFLILVTLLIFKLTFFPLIMSLGIYGLSAFVYILCIFGPFETSIRMRLIREISTAVQGKTREEILDQYNERVILDNRLKRLQGSGDIRLENGKYVLGKTHNVFFILDFLAGHLHGLIHKP